MFKKGLFKVVAPLAAASMLLAACGADDSSGSQVLQMARLQS